VRDTPTLPAVLTQLRRLASAHGKPYGLAVDKQGEEYLAAFVRCGLPMVAIERAVDQAIDLGSRFPRVAELIARAREFVPRTDGERQEGNPDLCGRCGGGFFYAGWRFPSGPVHPRLRCACPQPDDEWWAAEALAWTEGDPTMAHLTKPRDYATNRRYRERRNGETP
jgi:hypothetical protein